MVSHIYTLVWSSATEILDYRQCVQFGVLCVINAGSLAVSVTDMTAPVVGSSGGVYALVSAHLANVVMVSIVVCAWPCVCVCASVCELLPKVVIRSLSSYRLRTLPHEQSRFFWAPTGAVLSTDSIHSSPSPSACPRFFMFMWQLVEEFHQLLSDIHALCFWIWRRECIMVLPNTLIVHVEESVFFLSLPGIISTNRKKRLFVFVSLGLRRIDTTWYGGMWCQFASERDLNLCTVCCVMMKLKIPSLSFSLWQNWSGMKCQFKLFRMAMALVCSKFLILIKLIECNSWCHLPEERNLIIKLF